MTVRALNSRLVHEVQQAIAALDSGRSPVDRQELAVLAKEVFASIDARDLRGLGPTALVDQLEQLMGVLGRREKNEIRVEVRRDAERNVTVVMTCVEDQAFLVSTVRSALGGRGLEIGAFINAIVRVRRDPAGRLLRVGSGVAESVMRIELPGVGGALPDPPELEQHLRSRLRAVQAMVRDHHAMRNAIAEVADGYFVAAAGRSGEAAQMLREIEELLRWLCDEHAVLLSAVRLDAAGGVESCLGIRRVQDAERPAEILAEVARGEGRLARFERSTEESLVHRAGKPGSFYVTRFGADGEPAGVLAIDVLFTYKGLHTPPEQVPLIRLALREMLEDRQVPPTSDRGRNITNAFNSLPLEYLLSQDRESIWELTDRILRAEAEGGSEVHIRVGERSRFAFVVVALPRWQFSEELRMMVQSVVLEELGATYADYGVYIDRYDNAVIHFYVTGIGPLRTVDTEGLRQRVLAFSRSWNERLTEAIEAIDVPPSRLQELLTLYESAFDDEHKRRCSVRRLRGDIECLERIRNGAGIDCDLYVSEFGDHPGSLNLRLFSREALSLSQELPVIANFGFELIDQYSRDVRLPGMPPVDMDNFRLNVRPERIGHIMGRRAEILRALVEVFEGRAGDDDLNRLIVASQLGVQEVEVLRGYVAYLRQLQLPFPPDLVRATLVDHPTVAEALVAWLAARFDPRVADGQPAEAAETTEEALTRELREITDYTADRVLSAVAEVVRATRRTNAFAPSRAPGEPRAYKIATSELSMGPKPRPFREIWVYHRDFEGVHLRGGRVARGGLRFSDRPEDFRTEIHGLMATQMVKNVLIVPMGAKGGFVLRHAPVEREELRRRGDAVYAQFVSALLSITDNVIDGRLRAHPDGILPYEEGHDPYLVVAADKGTAHLSDTANRLSQARGFWLDDAFASGGSNGYDHKKTGITARGAWEVSKRSFRELGVDPEHDVITAVGVGDMSGDVFGNGLLRSRTVKLLAAFNHLHIFIDPDPDPERSYAERKRLFELPRSAWSDYDPAVLSEGGGVYPRKSKVVDLSPRARAVLGISPGEVVGGDEVVRAILRAPVDLMWMGGIGTYVKARHESHADVGDKANDGVRVNGAELRCKVLAEGANLAITDRGRVEYAGTGGQNYNAFLDNSGGVDTSDHEVNIKILFAPLLNAGEVTREERNELLMACEPDVVQMVLDNNRTQSRMASFDVRRSQLDVHRYARALRYLAEAVPFDPAAFAMPTEEELQARSRKGLGLYKAEAAVLCAHAKMLAYQQLLDCDPLPDPMIDRAATEYFPPRIVDRVGPAALRGHLLRREIATTMLVNEIVGDAGATVVTELALASGTGIRDAVLAHCHARSAGGLEELLRDLYACEDKHRQEVVYNAMIRAQGWVEDATFYLLDHMDLPPVDDDAMARARELLAEVEAILPAGSKQRTTARITELKEKGIPEELAGRVVRLRYLTSVIDAVRLAPVLGRSPGQLLRLRLSVTDAMNFLYLHQAIDRMVYARPWDGPAVQALRRQLNFHLHKLVRLVEGDDVAGMIERYGLSDFTRRVYEEAEAGPSISGLVMLDDWLRRLLPPLVAIE